MKKLYLIGLMLMLTLSTYAQSDTTYTIKTINKDRTTTGYLVITIIDHKVIATKRINSFKELKETNLMKEANAVIRMSDIPKDLLKPNEYLKNGVHKF